jgi:hypothetical protein
MTQKTIVLSDIQHSEFVPHSLNGETTFTLNGKTDWLVESRKLTEGLSQGIHVVSVKTPLVSVEIIPTRGMGLGSAVINGQPVQWNSPVRNYVHPFFVDLKSRHGLGWLDGFNEFLCRCGLASNGPPGVDEDCGSPVMSDLTLHGRVANLPAEYVECVINDEGDENIIITGVVREATMFGPNLELRSSLIISTQSARITIRDTITNHASHAAETQLLYHINIGQPFVGVGSHFVAPVSKMSPRDPRASEGVSDWTSYLAPTPGYAEQAYYCEMYADAHGKVPVMLHNHAGNLAVELQYNPNTLPCFTLWKNTQAYDDGYCTGLEPGTNFPNFKGFERQHQRVPKLESKASIDFELQLTVHNTSEAVEECRERIMALQTEPAMISHRPLKGWSPHAVG